ncbi:cytosolic carboxypeptidase-like protein 5 isoform X2 [Sitodiplosis mosellana]|uniref:cytosolic carboxypeptidase-like protein 5 isoform X2 n=1 Tax=Sitodiplosis mosellana TaxID=263140 RepID=UPI0024437A38|nr:cytosolic carboxypeptidase-like protein 5 isoform X2 [Sitodiplosis mosellana]
MDNFICAGYIFSSKFDSGNLHKVELVKWHEEAQPNNEAVAVELNLWTKPDCAGTEYENLNRSWFFFSIQGGEPNKVCKLNIVNLNKQSKLFSQGMHPVIRVGETGKWERTKYSPVYNVNDNEFVLSFLHKPQTDITTKFYYAFTFPFTFTECQNQLARFDSLYLKSEDEMNYILQRLNVDVDVDINCNTINFENTDVASVENVQNAPNEQTPTRVSTSRMNMLENQSNDEIENDIYYHRELLINSVEGRRVDLLTITSFHNIQNEHEHRFNELFPDPHSKRCKLFKNKKIIFISSRVHPGETPASFILNGFLKMILDRKNRYATILRKMYVFKIIPLLNPDGVYNGHYRSDVLGHNLNRVYLAPKKETQPPIFAVRKLIRYYHNEKDIDDESLPTTANAENNNESVDINVTNETAAEIDVPNLELDIASSGFEETDTDTPERESSEEKTRSNNVLTEINIEAKNNRNIEKIVSMPPSNSSTPSISLTQSPTTETELESKPSCSTESTSAPSSAEETAPNTIPTVKVRKVNSTLKTGVNSSKSYIAKPTISSIPKVNSTEASTSNVEVLKVKKLSLRPSSITNQSSFMAPASLSGRDSGSDASGRYSSSTFESARSEKKKEPLKSNTGNNNHKLNRKLSKNDSDTLVAPMSGGVSSRSPKRSSLLRKFMHAPTPANINISSDFCKDSNQAKCDEQSNMFLYIDLHGHASKKGVFMYGNYLPKIAESVECMLLPRLMSMNSHHFHFDACVFSERNMYHKGKRDGLSKEGSGRVAIYKMIGLIKSYTLEGNYNTGKYVNVLPPREKELNPRKICTIPPKYTPNVFEEVGRALGPSILDLTESNPSSRLRMSEFRSLQGLRNALRNDIERGLLRADPIQKATTSHTKLKSLKTSTACSSPLTTDVCKENKERHTTNKPSISYGKKEKSTNVSLSRKKGKVLCDVITSTSTTAPIPTKRQKVVANKKFTSVGGVGGSGGSGGDKIEPKDNNATGGLDLDMNAISNLNLKSDDTVPANSTPNTAVSASDVELSAFIDQPTVTSSFDPDVPCCSYQLLPQPSTTFNPFKFPNAPKKPMGGNFLRKTSASTSSMLIGQSSIVQSTKIKSSAIKLRSGFNSAGTSGAGSRLKSKVSFKSSLTKDGRRLKKKKSLKADTGIKRKKSKVF